MTNNPILNRLNQPQSNNMVESFNQFKKSIQGQDPKALVMSLLNSGKMSREQFEQLSRQANSLMNIRSRLEDRISQLEQMNSQLFLAQQMTGVVKYPMSFGYNAGTNPFCHQTTTTPTTTG